MHRYPHKHLHDDQKMFQILIQLITVATAASLALEDFERANSFFTFSMIDAMLDDSKAYRVVK
jgi:hypothetical protein